MTMRAAALAGVLFVAGMSAPAHGGSNIIGFGNLPCAEVLRVYREPAYRAVFIGWIGGFMTGVNAVTIVRDKTYRPLDNLNSDLIVGTVVAYCTANPGALMVQGAEKLFFGLPSEPWTE
jgi:hypothetical protein